MSSVKPLATSHSVPTLSHVCRHACLSPPTCSINGLTHLNLTKLDVLSDLEEIKVGAGLGLPCLGTALAAAPFALALLWWPPSPRAGTQAVWGSPKPWLDINLCFVLRLFHNAAAAAGGRGLPHALWGAAAHGARRPRSAGGLRGGCALLPQCTAGCWVLARPLLPAPHTVAACPRAR